ncbi:MAG: aldehyde dehydrogenase family protein [Luteitalea sp.]|nr:aldehyde dehydrogenase family protein [Luteitalea sp.]
MAEAIASASTDRDLASVAEARALARQAKTAQLTLAELSQPQVDAIVDRAAEAATAHAQELAALAVDETGYGVVEDKIQKNLFASQRVHAFIRPMPTVGAVRRLEAVKVVEIAEPFGVVAAVVPSTNPTSTAIYKILIALKARCAIVLSPHPAAVGCITRTAELMEAAARQAGAPAGAIGWMRTVTIEGTQELMKHRDVAVILATGGMGLVRAAYSAGKPAYGVGPGNAPAYIEETADIDKAVGDIITGKTFDNGVLCSAENSVVVDESIESRVRQRFQATGGYFLSPSEIDLVARVLVTSQRLPNPALVGKSAALIAERAGVTVPAGTRVLLAPLAGVGRDHPLSIEKLCPVLSYYIVKDWREGCERCKEILRYGGMGHTMAIHSRNDDVILQFGLHKPANRIVVNTPTTHGSIGLTTGLDPAMTLGCGGFGGNITSDNISPRHLLNIKRLAYETQPAAARPDIASGSRPVQATAAPSVAPAPRLPAPPAVERGLDAATLTGRIDAFLASRGIQPAPTAPTTNVPAGPATSARAATAATDAVQDAAPIGEESSLPGDEEAPAPFVCEEDVRDALKTGRKIRLAQRAIVTPAARELAEAHRVFLE